MPGLNGFDAAIMEFIQSNFHNSITDTIMPIFTRLGEMGLFWIAIGLGLLISKKTRSCGIVMLFAMLLTFLTGEVVMKNIICRPRPCQEYPDYVVQLIPPLKSYSFPSGHSASSFAAATAIFAFFKKWGIGAYVLAACIAFSRIFLFAHYPTDVLAGILLGVLFALLSLWMYRRFVLPRFPQLAPKK